MTSESRRTPVSCFAFGSSAYLVAAASRTRRSARRRGDLPIGPQWPAESGACAPDPKRRRSGPRRCGPARKRCTPAGEPALATARGSFRQDRAAFEPRDVYTSPSRWRQDPLPSGPVGSIDLSDLESPSARQFTTQRGRSGVTTGPSSRFGREPRTVRPTPRSRRRRRPTGIRPARPTTRRSLPGSGSS